MDNIETDTSKEHKKYADLKFNFAFLTISDSRNKYDDLTGIKAKELIEKEIQRHKVISHEIVKDDKKQIIEKINDYLDNSNIDVIITSGGTGITNKDITIETIRPLFEKELISFNVLFTNLSYDNIGSSAMLSRATAGIVKNKVIFCLPGSPRAVKLAIEKLILPEIGHIMKHIGD